MHNRFFQKVPPIKEGLQTLNKGYSSTFPSFRGWASETFDQLRETLVSINLIGEITIGLLDLLKFTFKKNKNLEKTSDIILNWAKIGFMSLLIFGLTAIDIVLKTIITGAFLLFNPFVSFVKAIGFGINMLMSDSLEEKEAHYRNLKQNIYGAIFAGITALCTAGLIFIPGAPLAASSTFAVVATVTIAAPVVMGIVDTLKEFLPRIWNKWWQREEKENNPEIMKLDTLVESRRVSRPFFFKPIRARSAVLNPHPVQLNNHGYFKNIVINKYLPFPTLDQDIENHIEGLNEKLGKKSFIDNLFFNKKKYKDKVESLKLLQHILDQWNQLIIAASKGASHNNYLIHLNGEDYLKLDGKFDLSQQREHVITLVKKYVLKNYPAAFQSFAKFARGDTETLFDQAFNWMRRNKTKDEMNIAVQAIQKRIDDYKKHHHSTLGRLERFNVEGKSNTDSIHLLQQFLDAVTGEGTSLTIDSRNISLPNSMENSEKVKMFKDAFRKNINMQSSFAAVGERAKIFEDICALLDSKKLALTLDKTPAPYVYEDASIHNDPLILAR